MSETAKIPDSGKTLANDNEESVVKDDKDTAEVVGVTDNKEMTVDVEVKDDATEQKNGTKGATKETVEVKIEGLSATVENDDTGKKEKQDYDVIITGVDTVAESEKEMEVSEVPETQSDSKVDSDVKTESKVVTANNTKESEVESSDNTKKAASSNDLSEIKEKRVGTNDANAQEGELETGKDTDTKGEETTDSGTDIKVLGKTGHITKPSIDRATTESPETVQTPDTTPTKSDGDQSPKVTSPLAAQTSSTPASKKTDVLEQEPTFDKPFPESLAKLRNLTVNIGPIRQMDLRSEKLHEILKLTDNFEIKFELRDKKDSTGKIVQEKSGFVRLPFEITTPTFLIRVAYRLGNLHIDGRDMSVKFPDAFNKAVLECQQYIDDNRKFRTEKFEQRKRQIAVKNVPPNVTEDTMRSLFPEAQKITLNMEETLDGGSKVGSVLLEFDTEEACVQCLDTNKDVFVEDCQLKIFRLFSDKVNAFQKKYKNQRTQQFSRGRGQGRGRGMAQRGNYQAAKIRNRALGFGNTVRGRGGVAKRGGNFGRKPMGVGQLLTKPGMNSQGSTNKGPPASSQRDMVSPKGRDQRSRTFSGSNSGKYQKSGNFEGQFKDFTPKREFNNRGRQRNRRGLGSNMNSNRSPSFRGEHSRQSPYRGERSLPYRSSSSYRNEQRHSSQSSSREEDPMAMMEYLKSTIARMEEKMTGKDHGDHGYGNRHDEQSRISQYSPHGRGSSQRGRGWGDQNRKRPADSRDYGHEAKRQFTDVERRDSFGNTGGGSQSDYRYDRDASHSGDSYGAAYGNIYGGKQTSSYGNRGGSDYDSGDRNKRDNYGGGQRFNSGYCGGGGHSVDGGQFGGRGAGRGQSSRAGRGYNRNKKGQW